MGLTLKEKRINMIQSEKNRLMKKDISTMERVINKFSKGFHMRKLEEILVKDGIFSVEMRMHKHIPNVPKLEEFVTFWEAKGVDIEFKWFEYPYKGADNPEGIAGEMVGSRIVKMVFSIK